MINNVVYLIKGNNTHNNNHQNRSAWNNRQQDISNGLLQLEGFIHKTCCYEGCSVSIMAEDTSYCVDCDAIFCDDHVLQSHSNYNLFHIFRRFKHITMLFDDNYKYFHDRTINLKGECISKVLHLNTRQK